MKFYERELLWLVCHIERLVSGLAYCHKWNETASSVFITFSLSQHTLALKQTQAERQKLSVRVCANEHAHDWYLPKMKELPQKRQHREWEKKKRKQKWKYNLKIQKKVHIKIKYAIFKWTTTTKQKMNNKKKDENIFWDVNKK